MKTRKRSTTLWAVTGAILALCTLGTAVYGMHSSPVLALDTTAVVEAAEQTLSCAQSGDYEALSQMLYGAPKLGDTPEKAETAESAIWQAYLDSIAYQVDDTCYAAEDAVALDVSIQCLDISAVTASMKEIVPDLLLDGVKNAEDPDAVYQSDGSYQEDFVDEVLYTAAKQVLKQKQPVKEQTLTLHFAHADGQWQAVPDQALQQFLSGYVTQ